MENLNIVKFCAEECERQRSGEMSVYDMINAWSHAQHRYLFKMIDKGALTVDAIEQIGKIVEPIDNRNGFRKVPIGVSNGFDWIEKAKWERVPELLTLLIESYYKGILYSPEYSNPLSINAEDEFYFEYENIHPFVDGNGRSGKILYNYLNGTLDNPIMPPNFWGSSNP